MQKHADIRNEKIKNATARVEAAERLAYALKSQDGQMIMSELRAQYNNLIKGLENISLKTLDAPFFEYDKVDLQKMKSYRAQIHFMTELLDNLNPDRLLDIAQGKRAEAKAYQQGEPVTPAY